jgi:endonuclease III related protein
MPVTRILPSPSSFRNRTSPPRSEPAAGRHSLAMRHIPLYYDALFRAFGPQHWWPGRTRFEVIVGAILTQNTSWSNVERAISALRREKLLTPAAIATVSVDHLAQLIRSSGYFRQKARKLKEFGRFFDQHYAGSLNKLFAVPTAELREQLLTVHGIGPETADSILLYAGHHKVFVVDAYTRRILERHALVHPKSSYEEIRALFETTLPPDVFLFNEYHALIVHTGKHYCRSRQPDCANCPLSSYLPSLAAAPGSACPEERRAGLSRGTRGFQPAPPVAQAFLPVLPRKTSKRKSPRSTGP